MNAMMKIWLMSRMGERLMEAAQEAIEHSKGNIELKTTRFHVKKCMKRVLLMHVLLEMLI